MIGLFRAGDDGIERDIDTDGMRTQLRHAWGAGERVAARAHR